MRQCIVHLIRNSFWYAGRQHRGGIVKALKPVYTAPSEQAAKDRFEEFAAEWGGIPRSSSSGVVPERSSCRSWSTTRDPPGDLHDQRGRVDQRPLPLRGQSARALPERAGRAQVPLPGDEVAWPDWRRESTLGDAVETRAQRVRDHLRRTPDLPFPPHAAASRRLADHARQSRRRSRRLPAASSLRHPRDRPPTPSAASLRLGRPASSAAKTPADRAK